MGLGEGAALLSKDETESINTECAICLDSEMTNPIVLTGCKHAFCASCLLRWQERQRRSPTVSTEATSLHSCPLCRAETTNVADALLLSARLNAERANRPGCTQEERDRFRQEALANVEQALDSENPHLHAYCIKIDILTSLGDGQAALDCIEEMEKINEQRSEKRRELKRMAAEAQAAVARGDHNADGLMESVEQRFTEEGLPQESFAENKYNQFGIELQRAEACQVLKEWESAKEVYFRILQSMEGPQDGSAPQQRQVFMGLSRCAYELGVYDKSIAGAEAALDYNRHFPGVHRYKALSEKALGNIDAAIRTMNRAVLYETPWDECNKAENLKLYKELLAETSE